MGFPDTPVELSDGTLVCEDHGLQICHQCCCDYTFMNDNSEQSQISEVSSISSEEFPDRAIQIAEPANEILRGTAAKSVANAQASKYCEDCQLTWMTATPGSATTDEECPFHDSLGGARAEQRTFLVHVDGACSGNGKQNAVGGIGIYFGPSSSFNLSAPLTSFTTIKPHTSQKAELQAAASAMKIIRNGCIPARRQLLEGFLGRCPCHRECWAAALPFQVVIITDSAYLFDCITSHLLIWRWNSESRTYSNKKSGNVIKNSEHIRNIVEEVELLAERGVQILWKKVPRELNQEADRLAKTGAEMSSTSSGAIRLSTIS